MPSSTVHPPESVDSDVNRPARAYGRTFVIVSSIGSATLGALLVIAWTKQAQILAGLLQAGIILTPKWIWAGTILGGLLLYVYRCWILWAYGLTELAGAIVSIVYAAQKRPDDPLLGFQLVASIYVVVRGLDNIDKGLREGGKFPIWWTREWWRQQIANWRRGPTTPAPVQPQTLSPPTHANEVRLNASSRLGIVCEANQGICALHLRASLQNNTAQAVTLTALGGVLVTPNGGRLPLYWKIFFQDNAGHAESLGEVRPISVNPGKSVQQNIELRIQISTGSLDWPTGVYRLNLEAFFHNESQPQLQRVFEFDLQRDQVRGWLVRVIQNQGVMVHNVTLRAG